MQALANYLYRQPSPARAAVGPQQNFSQLPVINSVNDVICDFSDSQPGLRLQTPRSTRSHRVGQPSKGAAKGTRTPAPHTASVKMGVLAGVPVSSVCPNVHVTGPLLCSSV